MNKSIIRLGLFALCIVFLFPPWDTPDIMARAFARALGSYSSATKIELAPIWDSPHSDAEINAGVWIAVILVVSIATVALAYLVKPSAAPVELGPDPAAVRRILTKNHNHLPSSRSQLSRLAAALGISAVDRRRLNHAQLREAVAEKIWGQQAKT